MADETENKAEAPQSGGGSKGPVILGVLNLLVTGGLAAVIFLGLPQSKSNAAEAGVDGGPVKVAPAPDEDEPGPVVELDDFVVQLRNPEFDRYLRVRFHIEVNSSVSISDIEKLLPKIRDDFISYMSDRTYEELRGSRGLKRVKRELFDRLLTLVPPDTVRTLLVTKFVVQ